MAEHQWRRSGPNKVLCTVCGVETPPGPPPGPTEMGECRGFKLTLVLDFDGVLHSYTSGWKGARVIPDPPVPGALEALVGYVERFDVAIVSSRSHQWGGRRAMKRWLQLHLRAAAGSDYSATPEWWRRKIAAGAFADPWEDDVAWAARCVVKRIRFPRHKPPAHLTIDDRAVTFEGFWPRPEQIAEFKPWNRR